MELNEYILLGSNLAILIIDFLMGRSEKFKSNSILDAILAVAKYIATKGVKKS